MALVMQLWEERRGEDLFARRRGIVCKEGESLDSRLSTLDMQIQDQLRCQHLNP
jgi:hypothetical protein